MNGPDPSDVKELERFREFLAARARLRKHKAVLSKYGADSASDLFGYQLRGSPYYDADWGHCSQHLINADRALILSAALGEDL